MDSGGQIRTGKLLERLKDIFEVTLVSNVESPRDDPYLDQVRELCTDFYPVPWTEVRKSSLRFYFRVMSRLFSRYPIAVLNDYSPAIERTLFAALRARPYDLLVCDFLQPSLNFEKLYEYPTLLFQHNVESVLLERRMQTQRNPIIRLFFRSQFRKMQRYERVACRRFTAVVSVSDLDKTFLQHQFGARRVFAIPTGVDTEYFVPRQDPVEPDSLIFVGSMDWPPNEDAVLFFAREILGTIKQEIPTVRLTVVGRKPSRHLLAELQRYPEVRIIGSVPDIRPFVGRHAVCIIPLRTGGGTRIKVYEAMAMGKAVVSTRVGVEGLPVEDGKQVIIADRADQFAGAVVRLLRNHGERRRIARAARDFVAKSISWEKAAEAFANACRSTVGGYQQDSETAVLD